MGVPPTQSVCLASTCLAVKMRQSAQREVCFNDLQ